jgi:dihydroorotase
MMYDTIITGGRLIDPGQGLDALQDIAISNGLITAVSSHIPVDNCLNHVDVKGKLIVPGLIDLHTHLYQYGTEIGMEPDLAGVRSGVTTLVDAGSAGSDTYLGFHHHVLPSANTQIFSLLHIGRIGLAHMPEILGPDDINLDETIEMASRFPGEIVGIKVRACGPAIESMGINLIKLARQAADDTGTRLMVHIGDPFWESGPTLTRDLLPLLQPHDIVTHLYTGAEGRVISDDGVVMPELLEARDKGVIFDTAHGRHNLSFDVAKRLLDKGVLPVTISTDITPQGRGSSLRCMTHLMGKYLALGFSLHDVILMATRNPAEVLGLHGDLGTLAEGTTADITIIDEVDGDWVFHDTLGESIRGSKALKPILTFKNGTQYAVDYGPFPWGWLPNPD